MLLALALTAVLTADPPAPEPELTVDESAEAANERQQVVRIGTTALGGALGIVVPLLLGLAWTHAQGPCTPFSPCDLPYAVTSSFLPLTVGAGLMVPHALSGGRAGTGFGLAGAVFGYMSAASLLGLVSLAAGSDWPKSAPAAGAGFIAGMSLVGAVTALELRHSELEAGAKEWKLGRLVAESAAFLLPAGLTEALIIWLAIATNPRDGGAVALAATLGTTGNFVLSSLVAWGVHRALGGRGAAWAAAVGALASTGAAFCAILVHTHAPPEGGIFAGPGGRGTRMSIPIAAIIIALGMVGPAVGLEWSNARKKGFGRDEKLPFPGDEKPGLQDHIQVQVGIGPGGTASLGLTGSF